MPSRRCSRSSGRSSYVRSGCRQRSRSTGSSTWTGSRSTPREPTFGFFRSLSDELARTVLETEFEPGIIDAYEGEDLLSDLLVERRGRGFWVSELLVRGSTRIDSRLAARLFGSRASYLDASQKTAPGWAEISYFNDLARECFGEAGAAPGLCIRLLASPQRLRSRAGFARPRALRCPFRGARAHGSSPDQGRFCPAAARPCSQPTLTQISLTARPRTATDGVGSASAKVSSRGTRPRDG
jgi:hypothetical protein